MCLAQSLEACQGVSDWRMFVRVSRPIAALLCGLATLVLFHATVDAQTRRAVPRSSGGRRVSSPRVARPNAPNVRAGYFRGYGYRPYYGVYDPFFFGPHPYQFYGPRFYGQRYERGSLRLEVKPEETEVFVDGYAAGVVDSYDGYFQRLHLPPGEHEVELYLNGYESTRETLYVVEGQTYRIRRVMQPLPDGVPQPMRPEPVVVPETTAYGNEYPVAREVPSVSADRFGTLAVQVQPGDAVVRVDGEVWNGFEGLDRVVIELGEGIHTVEVRRDGYRTYQTSVEVVEGDTTLLNVSLPTAEDGR